MQRTKLSAPLVKGICEGIRRGNYANVTAAAAGITEKTYYLWIREARDTIAIVAENTHENGRLRRGFKLTERQRLLLVLIAEVEKAEAEAEAAMLSNLMGLATVDRNPQAAMWLLERRFSKRWGKQGITIEAEGEGANGLEIKVLFPINIPDADRESAA